MIAPPYQVSAAVRKSDPVTVDQCRKALVEEGASILFGETNPQLRFTTEEEAETARKHLTEKLPNSEQIWVIAKEVGAAEDWLQR